jgi:hypothetical protein
MCAALFCTPACLVLDLHPLYGDESIGFDPALVGMWVDADDRSSLQIERSEWRSYRIHYVHPIERGDLTGYMTAIDDVRYLDVMPARGQDSGAFLIPVHAVLRVDVQGDRLELTPLSFDWFSDRRRRGADVPGLALAVDQKDNVLIASPTAALRAWLRGQPADGAMFGAPAVFTRTEKTERTETTKFRSPRRNGGNGGINPQISASSVPPG